MELTADEAMPVSASEASSTDTEVVKSSSIDPASLRASPGWRDLYLRTLAVLIAIGITIVLVLSVDQDQIKRFQEYGYFGIFMTSLIGNATIAMPIPSLFFTFVGGGTLNWVIVGLVSGVGEALGESTGYLAGYGGTAIIENSRTQQWMKKRGTLTIFLLSVMPNPIVALAGIAAGASSFGYLKFLICCCMGKTVKTVTFALAGAYSITWLFYFLGGWVS